MQKVRCNPHYCVYVRVIFPLLVEWVVQLLVETLVQALFNQSTTCFSTQIKPFSITAIGLYHIPL